MFGRKKKKPSLSRDLRAVRRAGIRTSIVVLLLTSGISPAFVMWYGQDNSSTTWIGSVRPLWQIAAQTYPLTVTVALIAFGKRQGWFPRFRIFYYCALLTVGVGLTNLTSQWTGQAIDQVHVLQPHRNPITGTLVAGVNHLASYVHTYGSRQFLAAVFIGSCVGWAANRLQPHMRFGPESMERIGEVVGRYASREDESEDLKDAA